jgi:hypothetical protein
MDEDDRRFFDTLRGIPTQKTYGEMNEKFFNFRLKIDDLNKKLDTDLNFLRSFDSKLK